MSKTETVDCVVLVGQIQDGESIKKAGDDVALPADDAARLIAIGMVALKEVVEAAADAPLQPIVRDAKQIVKS
jgi:hypothetical protein